MKSALDVAPSQVLQLATSLDEQVAWRNSDFKLLSIWEPYIKSWVGTPPMNSQEIVIVVQANEGLPWVASGKVEPIRC